MNTNGSRILTVAALLVFSLVISSPHANAQIKPQLAAWTQSGSDWCAKVNSAFSTLGSGPTIVVMDQSAGTAACSSGNITLAANETLEFAQGGTYNLGSKQILLNSGAAIKFEGSNSNGSGVAALQIDYSATTGAAIRAQTQSASANSIELTGFLLDCTGGAGNNAVGVDMSGISDSDVRGVNIGDCGTDLLADTAAGGSTENNNYYSLRLFSSSAGSGYTLAAFKNAANAQHIWGSHFSRGAIQLSIGNGNSGSYYTNEVACSHCTFEVADTESIDDVFGLAITLDSPRFEANALAVKVENNSANQVIVHSPYLASNTTDWSVLGGSLILPPSAGTVTLSGGTGSHTFTVPYGTAPTCAASDQSGTNAVKVTSTTTAVSLTGTGTDVIGWNCIAGNN